MRTAWNTIFVYGIINIFQRKFVTQRDKSTFKMQVMKKAFIDFNGIKSGISKKSFGIYKRMFVEKILL